MLPNRRCSLSALRDYARPQCALLECSTHVPLLCVVLIGTPPSQDVDLVVLTTRYSQEHIKQILIDADSQFYLVPSKDPYATYKVLWYRLGSYAGRCKVDVLQPGIMNIPNVPIQHIETIKGLPVMPLTLLLFMKLQAWTDHRDSSKHYMRSKQYTDLVDISKLLDIAVERGEVMGHSAKWMPEEFVRSAVGRMKEHITLLPDAKAKQWRIIGYKS